MERRKLYIILAGALVIGGLAALQMQDSYPDPPESNSTNVVAENLEIPWEIVFLENGDMLVTERPGTLVRIERNGDETQKYEIEGVEHRGEGGLLGMAKHPNFEQNNLLYLYMTTETEDGLTNRVVRYNFENNQLSNPETVIEELPGAQYHDGGRIAFGPDNNLYITAGDATNENWAQQTDILAGKILRLSANGSAVAENPFGNEAYSYGHRNPQGIAWVDGQLWVTEHGRSGFRSGMDELNSIEPGGNYGWPVIEGNETQEGMISPEIHSGADTTWAPAGAAYIDGSLYFAGLRGKTLYEAQIQDGEVQNLEEHLVNEYGRLRAVVVGPEGDLYISTSNTDGRGTPRNGDDKIIRIDPESLQ